LARYREEIEGFKETYKRCLNWSLSNVNTL
jgi:hypothetical protein